MAISLADLRIRARQRADMVNSEFVEDNELNGFINSSIAELHDILIQAYDSDYYIQTYEFSTVTSQQEYDLPADFYKLKGVDARINTSDWISLRTFNFNERNRFEKFGVWDVYGLPLVRYRLVGSKLHFTPIPEQATPIRLWYVPVATQLVNDTDELVDLNQYSEYVIVDAARKMLMKEESDVTEITNEKAALLARITSAAQNRDVGQSESVSDVYAEDDPEYFWRS